MFLYVWYTLINEAFDNLRNILLFKHIRCIFQACLKRENSSKYHSYEIKYRKDRACIILHGKKIGRDVHHHTNKETDKQEVTCGTHQHFMDKEHIIQCENLDY